VSSATKIHAEEKEEEEEEEEEEERKLEKVLLLLLVSNAIPVGFEKEALTVPLPSKEEQIPTRPASMRTGPVPPPLDKRRTQPAHSLMTRSPGTTAPRGAPKVESGLGGKRARPRGLFRAAEVPMPSREAGTPEPMTVEVMVDVAAAVTPPRTTLRISLPLKSATRIEFERGSKESPAGPAWEANAALTIGPTSETTVPPP